MKIKISGPNFESKRTNDAAVIFRRGGSSAIRFIVAGERAATLMFERDLINELAASKQWYSPLVLSYYPWYLVGISIIFSVLTLAFVALNFKYIANPAFDFLFSKIFIPASILWPFLLILLGIAFPPIIFDFGEGARRQKFRIAIVSIILVSIIIGLLVNLSSDFLKDWLTGASGTHS